MVTAPADREFVVGDVEEEFRARGNDRRWLWTQLASSVLPLLRERVRKERWLRRGCGFIGVILAAYAIVAFPVILAQWLAPGILIDAAMMGVAGCVSAFLGRRRGMLFVRGLAAFFFAMWLVSLASSIQGEPLWYQVFLGAGVIISALAGGYLQKLWRRGA